LITGPCRSRASFMPSIMAVVTSCGVCAMTDPAFVPEIEQNLLGAILSGGDHRPTLVPGLQAARRLPQRTRKGIGIMGGGGTQTTTETSGLNNKQLDAAVSTIGTKLNQQLGSGLKVYDQSLYPGLSGQTMAGISILSSNPN